jgi:hypothetical protein
MDTSQSSRSIDAARTAILERLSAAAKQGGHRADGVTLVAISKKQPDERIEAMLATGQRVFGENRVQEAQGRWSERRETFRDLELRLVGPLQTNKAADACALEKTGRRPRLYVQVNTGDEAQKAGISVAEAPDFVARCRAEHGLEIEGLMCIPPVEEPASLHFALLAKLARTCGVERLSMGMSADFELAARLGASSVRVGSALFGERPAPEA